MPEIELRDLENYAEVLLWAAETSRREPFRNGDIVVVRYDVPALRLVEVLYSRLIDAHLRPVPVANPTPYMEAELYLNSSFGQLTFSAPGQEELYGAAAGVINVLAPDDLLHLSRVDPRTIADYNVSRANEDAVYLDRGIHGEDFDFGHILDRIANPFAT